MWCKDDVGSHDEDGARGAAGRRERCEDDAGERGEDDAQKAVSSRKEYEDNVGEHDEDDVHQRNSEESKKGKGSVQCSAREVRRRKG